MKGIPIYLEYFILAMVAALNYFLKCRIQQNTLAKVEFFTISSRTKTYCLELIYLTHGGTLYYRSAHVESHNLRNNFPYNDGALYYWSAVQKPRPFWRSLPFLHVQKPTTSGITYRDFVLFSFLLYRMQQVAGTESHNSLNNLHWPCMIVAFFTIGLHVQRPTTPGIIHRGNGGALYHFLTCRSSQLLE